MQSKAACREPHGRKDLYGLSSRVQTMPNELPKIKLHRLVQECYPTPGAQILNWEGNGKLTTYVRTYVLW